jgi:hypothetical protein
MDSYQYSICYFKSYHPIIQIENFCASDWQESGKTIHRMGGKITNHVYVGDLVSRIFEEPLQLNS